ncbi:PadR family transcriptional regulator [uncultured Paludibaculum sp.]|uniref:PadR family transcriptional regulator n=1 Tax=uncultured Paludibaculum sp. TaxID=1765020 RepID=UPI002AAB3FA4|nr:PadR family transcriptional regulator [uncultured Paludibaculum sp.]
MTPAGQPAPEDLLPLTPLVFHILLCLGDGERHGYALKREIARRTEGHLNPGAGSLYGAIQKMLDQNLIEESGERPDAHLDDERRRYYRLSDLGRAVAQAEAARMRALVELSETRFGLGEPA